MVYMGRIYTRDGVVLRRKPQDIGHSYPQTRWILGGALAFLAIFPLFSPVLAAESNEIKVSKAQCEAMMRKSVTARPAPDVTYKPGVDVRGNKVAPAETTNRAVIKVPNEISFPITLDMADKYGIGGSTAFGAESTIGQVTYRNGRVYYNGQPLDGGDTSAIQQACEQTYGKR